MHPTAPNNLPGSHPCKRSADPLLVRRAMLGLLLLPAVGWAGGGFFESPPEPYAKFDPDGKSWTFGNARIEEKTTHDGNGFQVTSFKDKKNGLEVFDVQDWTSEGDYDNYGWGDGWFQAYLAKIPLQPNFIFHCHHQAFVMKNTLAGMATRPGKAAKDTK